VPLDFFSPENSFKTMNNFESSLTDLYARVRSIHFGQISDSHFMMFLGTDIARNARMDNNRWGNYDIYCVPTNGIIEYWWDNWYKIISNANTIINRLEGAELTDEQKKQVTAEAKFFRALSYRYLVHLYGGVPLITEEISAPKTDLVRASKEEVLNQIVSDLTEAVQNLPAISNVADGKVSNLVASHYLAETYIALGKYTEAITAASLVIDDPATSLMTSRFGTKANVTPGDPFWDLFQVGNQNRKTGNTEALWVAQMEIDVPGGLLETSSFNYNSLERYAGPVAYLTFKDPDGKEGSILKPQSDYNSGGRGVSFMSNTNYFLYNIWESDWDTDSRNASHNIHRDYVYTSPASAYYGKSAVLPDGKLNSPTWKSQNWRWYPYPTKITTAGDHPDAVFEDKTKLILKASAGTTFRDMYILRLAETYLLRAEAHLAKGDKTSTAADINMVRARSNATPVAAGDVTIDYILDERARELVYEEDRRITLQRLGKLVERVRLYNELNGDEIKDHMGIWPIPFAEIEANKDAVLEQNPGYAN
jgi:starch-binding outer membrane protein, SusD/RagB family